MSHTNESFTSPGIQENAYLFLDHHATGNTLDGNLDQGVHTRDRNNGPFQQWFFVKSGKQHDGKETVWVVNRATPDRCLEAAGGNVNFELRVENNDRQLWTVTFLTAEHLMLTNIGTNQSLDSDGGRDNWLINWTIHRVYMHGTNASDFQKWRFSYVNPELTQTTAIIKYEETHPPQSPVDLIAAEVIENRSDAEISKKITHRSGKTCFFEWSLKAGLKLSFTNKVALSVPGLGEAGSEYSVEISLEAGMRQSHETTITYEASQTVLMKSKKQYTIHSTLDWVDGLKTPFELTMYIYATAEGVGGRVHLNGPGIQHHIEREGFGGTIRNVSGTDNPSPSEYAVMGKIDGEFIGSYGLSTRLTVSEEPLHQG